VRRRLLVALIVLLLWTVGYLAYAIGNGLRATGPEEPLVREDAGEE
jgi:hypothetical protein